MRTGQQASSSGGYSLIELLLVLVILGMCLAATATSLAGVIGARAAGGAAQTWQAAAGWAQTDVLWHGGCAQAIYDHGDVRVLHAPGLCGGSVDGMAPPVPVESNLRRWIVAGRATVGFGGSFASPDGGGSLYFLGSGSSYRVIVRPESGLGVVIREETAR